MMLVSSIFQSIFFTLSMILYTQRLWLPLVYSAVTATNWLTHVTSLAFVLNPIPEASRYSKASHEKQVNRLRIASLTRLGKHLYRHVFDTFQ